MKKLAKNFLKWLNYKSVSIFARYHFRKQAKDYCKKNAIPEIDMEYQRDIKKFWRKYDKFPSTVFHRWYTGANGIKDVKYIPENFFYDVVERHYNDMTLEPAYSDKGMYRKLYSDIKQPTTIFVNMNGFFYDENYNTITKETACLLLQNEERVIIKPTRDSGGGKNVQFLDVKQYDSQSLLAIFDEYAKDYIVQLPLKQHPQLAALHKQSINTIRVMSMLENDEVSIVSTVIRMGVGNACVDNECSGGINCGVDGNGCLSDVAYDGSGKVYLRHPQGFEFNQGYVPCYDKVIAVIKEQHRKLPYFGLISWDFTVDENEEPVMIELNLNWCGLNFHQLHHGPLFGERTEEILDSVISKR